VSIAGQRSRVHVGGMRTPIVLPVVTAVLTLVAGLGALAVGLLLAALGMSGMGALDLPGVGPVIGLTVVAAATYGLVAIGASGGLLRDAPWALVAAGAVHVIGLLGALVALTTAGPSAPLVAGLGLTLGGLVAVVRLALTPASRPSLRAG
jgi:hypothetical protein